MATRLRTIDGTPPFTYRILSMANAVLDTVTSSEREVVMGVDPASFKWDITSSDGKAVSGSVDAVTKMLLKRVHNGIATPNGNPENHINSMNADVTLGLNAQTVEFDMRNVLMTDADFNNPIWTQSFDHVNGTVQTLYDETVKHAKATGIGIFVMVSPNRGLEHLNGVGGRTMFYGDADLMKRVDGSNVTGANANGYPLVGSIMATAFRNYYKAIMLKVATRYRNALNDGTIVALIPKLAQTAESHYEMDYVFNGARTGDADGDYHPNMIAAFKTHLQSYLTVAQFNTKFGTSIGSFNDITAGYLGGTTSFSSAIRKYWYWFRNEELAKFYDEMWDYLIANVAGLTRTAAAGMDMGSISDAQGKHRGCYNIGRMLKHPFVMTVKSNDGDSFPVEWCTTLLASLAETYNCIARIEPTMGNNTMNSNQGKFNEFVDSAKARNVGISFIDQYHVNPTGITNVVNSRNLAAYTTKTPRDVTRADNNICNFNYTLSQIIGDGGAWHGSPSIRSQFDAVDCGANTVKLITITDDIGPAVVAVNPPVDPPVSSGNYTPVFLQRSDPAILDLTIVQDSVAGTFKISDNQTRTPPNNHHWWYWVGSKVVRTNTRLQNEVWKGHQPGQVTKMAIRSDITDPSQLNLGVTVSDFQQVGSLFPERGDTGGITTFYFKEVDIT